MFGGGLGTRDIMASTASPMEPPCSLTTWWNSVNALSISSSSFFTLPSAPSLAAFVAAISLLAAAISSLRFASSLRTCMALAGRPWRLSAQPTSGINSLGAQSPRPLVPLSRFAVSREKCVGRIALTTDAGQRLRSVVGLSPETTRHDRAAIGYDRQHNFPQTPVHGRLDVLTA